MVAGTLGGLLTTWATFVPCFLWIFLGAPFVEALRGNRALGGALAANTAVVGVILNLAIWFGLHVLFAEVEEVHALAMSIDVPAPASLNVPSLVLALGALMAIFRFRIGMIPVLAACAALGVAYHLVGGAI
jgi:chromate transporter